MHCFTLAILLQKGSCSDILQNGTRLCMSDFSFVKFFEKTFVLFEDLLVSRQPVLGPVDGAVVLAVHVLKHRVLERGGAGIGLCLLWFRGEQEDSITCLLN